jgi:hypothetical protein
MQKNKQKLLEALIGYSIPLSLAYYTKHFSENTFLNNYGADFLVPLGIYNLARASTSKTLAFVLSVVPWEISEGLQAFGLWDKENVFDPYDFLAYALGGVAGVAIEEVRKYFKRNDKTNLK